MDFKVEGSEKMIERIKGFESETYKVLQREVREAQADIVSDAKGATPDRGLRRWGRWRRDMGSAGGFRNITGDRDFDASAIMTSIKPSFRTRRSQGSLGVYGRVNLGDAAGAIFSLAGKRNRSGHPFNVSINRVNGAGPWPRLLGPAWTNNIDKARNEIRQAVNRAAEKVNRG